MIKIYLSLLLFLSLSAPAQTVYYQNWRGQIFTEIEYSKLKNDYAEAGEYFEQIIAKETVGDSTKVVFKISAGKMPDGQIIDVFKDARTKIGSHFPLDQFGKKINGKPSLLYIWSTRMEPKKKINALNRLQHKFGTSVNFIAITWDNNNWLKEYMDKQPFNFEHVVSARKQIDSLGLTAFIDNYILLDKDGKLLLIEGFLPEGEGEVAFYLEQLLKD